MVNSDVLDAKASFTALLNIKNNIGKNTNQLAK